METQHVTNGAKLYPATEAELKQVTPMIPDFAAGKGLPAPADHPSAAWYAACVHSRHERVVAQEMACRDIPFYLPTYQSVRRWKDRQKRLEMVLFPGYVFVRIPLGERLRVLQVPGVARFVTFQGVPAPLAESEMDLLRLGMRGSGEIRPHPYLRAGRRVCIKTGPLAGVTGLLIRRKHQLRLVLSVDLIMRSVALEVDEADVEPA
jgi:transcription antitermination factor NusG